MSVAHCSHCGRPTEEHSRHLRFRLPDPVLGVPAEERPSRMWGSDVMMMVRDVGAFIRVLVPIRLSGGYTVTFGAWLGVHPDDLRRAYEVWNGPEYASSSTDESLQRILADEWEHEFVLAAVAPFE